jgi:hypothetical protein
MSATPSRRFVHTRSIRVKAFARDDGLWDLEAELTDVKEKDFALAVGFRRAGDPVHSMRLRCRRLRVDGPAVAKFYPRWYTGADNKDENLQEQAR